MGEETDIIVLLCFHADPNSFDLFFRSEGRKNTKMLQIWAIHWLQNTLGLEICHLLPFAHAIAVCDTTSCLLGIGKGVALQKFNSDPDFKEKAEVFSSDAS